MAANQRKQLPIHKPCACPRCRRVATANAKWGYDEAAVPTINCLVCARPIGHGPYLVDTSLARFGHMLFVHEARQLKKGGA